MVVPILMGEVDLQRMSGGAIGFLDRISQVVTAAKLKLAARQGGGEQFHRKQVSSPQVDKLILD